MPGSRQGYDTTGLGFILDNKLIVWERLHDGAHSPIPGCVDPVEDGKRAYAYSMKKLKISGSESPEEEEEEEEQASVVNTAAADIASGGTSAADTADATTGTAPDSSKTQQSNNMISGTSSPPAGATAEDADTRTADATTLKDKHARMISLSLSPAPPFPLLEAALNSILDDDIERARRFGSPSRPDSLAARDASATNDEPLFKEFVNYADEDEGAESLFGQGEVEIFCEKLRCDRTCGKTHTCEEVGCNRQCGDAHWCGSSFCNFTCADRH